MLLLPLAVLVAVPLLGFLHTDGSYTCRAGALADVLRPEPQLGADFRRNVAFDSGHACNQSARRQVTVASVLLAGSLAVFVYHSRRPADN